MQPRWLCCLPCRLPPSPSLSPCHEFCRQPRFRSAFAFPRPARRAPLAAPPGLAAAGAACGRAAGAHRAVALGGLARLAGAGARLGAALHAGCLANRRAARLRAARRPGRESALERGRPDRGGGRSPSALASAFLAARQAAPGRAGRGPHPRGRRPAAQRRSARRRAARAAGAAAARGGQRLSRRGRGAGPARPAHHQYCGQLPLQPAHAPAAAGQRQPDGRPLQRQRAPAQRRQRAPERFAARRIQPASLAAGAAAKRAAC